MLLSVCIALAAAALSGCALTGGMGNYVRNGFKVGPQYFRPMAEVEEDWLDAYDQRVLEQLPRNIDWWNVFGDPQLTDLVFTTYQQNLTLREAGLRVEEVRLQRAIVAGSLFPQQQKVVGDFTHRQISKTTVDNRPLVALVVPRAFDRWSTGVEAAWEVDVWGKFRRSLESADASLDATVEQYDDILLCLLAETATAYVDLRTAQERIRLARANVKAQQGTLGIAESRFKIGDTDELDVDQAKINVANTQALIPELEEFERKAELQLCILMGIPPRDLVTELGDGEIPAAPTSVAVGIPADLLRRRPDVRKAEREVAAESAKIGVAAADLLPQFSIRGSLRYSAANFSDLFLASSSAGAVTPGFNWDVLNYGRLKNNVLAQDTRFQQRAVHYQQTVLRANADVERALVSFLKGQERVERLGEAVVANEKALRVSIDQYKAGEVNYNQIFTLQSALVQEQDALAVARGDVAKSLIAVYKALGGGWQIRLDCGLSAFPATDQSPQTQVVPTTPSPEPIAPPAVAPRKAIAPPNKGDDAASRKAKLGA
jgi:NodT family efflux transporter outer membrane factor (OMF) lipoprotein